MSEIQYKRCLKCLQEKPRAAFSKGSKYKDGLQAWCKECYQRDHMARVGKEYYPPAPEGYKRCTKCKELLLVADGRFVTDSQKKDGLHPICRSCTSAHKKARYAANPEMFREIGRQNQKKYATKLRENHRAYRLAHPEVARKSRKKWTEENPEKDRQSKRDWQKRNPEKKRAQALRHRKENPEKYAAIKHRRRAIENSLPHDMTLEDWAFMFEYWENKCCVCGRCEGDGLILARDHWIPIKDKQGRAIGTVPDNMLPLCHSKESGRDGCNSTKLNIDPIEWLYSRYPEEQADEILAKILEYFEIASSRKKPPTE